MGLCRPLWGTLESLWGAVGFLWLYRGFCRALWGLCGPLCGAVGLCRLLWVCRGLCGVSMAHYRVSVRLYGVSMGHSEALWGFAP